MLPHTTPTSQPRSRALFHRGLVLPQLTTAFTLPGWRASRPALLAQVRLLLPLVHTDLVPAHGAHGLRALAHPPQVQQLARPPEHTHPGLELGKFSVQSQAVNYLLIVFTVLHQSPHSLELPTQTRVHTQWPVSQRRPFSSWHRFFDILTGVMFCKELTQHHVLRA